MTWYEIVIVAVASAAGAFLSIAFAIWILWKVIDRMTRIEGDDD